MNDRNRARDHGSGGVPGGLGGRGLLVTVPVLVEARLAPLCPLVFVVSFSSSPESAEYDRHTYDKL